MSTARPVADEDRLPWLEPYRETVTPKGRAARRAHGGWLALAGALAVLAAGGGYWLGRSDAPEPIASDTVAVPPARPEPAPIAEAPPVPRIEPPPATRVEPVPPPSVDAAAADRPKAKSTKRVAKRPVRRKIRTAGVESSRLRAVRAAQRDRSEPRRTVRVHRWPRMPSPGPAGQVIQLGAFTHPARANAAYRVRAARYPLLRRMPRVVVPIITKPDRRLLYVLRLGTTSRQQSHIVCRNLRRSGDHCLVIG